MKPVTKMFFTGDNYDPRNGRYDLWATVTECGDDISVTIGNSSAHVGAVALGCPRPRVNGQIKKATISSICAMEHRDDIMARLAAETIATEIDRRVAVSCGVHIDNATKNEVMILLEKCKELCSLIIIDINGQWECQ